jgi:two-component system response regulator RegX3
VLIVEDEPSLADSIRYGLEREGYECTVLCDGTRAVDFVRSWRPDVVLLDLMLPGMPGTDVCGEIRKIGRVPIVMVTAKDTEADKVIGLELGADDYITKPFGMRELIARVRAVMRRTGATEDDGHATSLAGGPVEMDTDRHEVRVRGRVVELPPKEFALLESLLRRSGKLMTRDSLIAQVWGEDYYGDTRTLDVHMKRLRAKIETDPRKPRHLITVRGLGYRFEP